MTTVAVYKITNSLNGKIYIGQTTRPERRFAEHTWKGSKSKILSAAIKNYGKESFCFEILCLCPDKAYANMVETKLIEAHDTRRVGYNICVGGEGFGSGEDHPVFGRVWSEEERKRHSDNMRGERNPHYGTKLTIEHKAKIREALLGREVTWGAKISAAKKGIRTSSDEQIAKAVAASRLTVIKPVRASRDGVEHTFDSLRECAAFFGLHEVTVQRYLRGVSTNRDGWDFTKIAKHG